MVFTGADVPLSEDILKKKVEFIPTLTEWSAQNREIVITSRSTTGTLFVIPIGETFFLTSASVDVRDTTGSGQAVITIDPAFDNTRVIQALCTSGGEAANSVSFPMPLKIEGGNSIIFTLNGTTQGGSATITGWREPKKIS